MRNTFGYIRFTTVMMLLCVLLGGFSLSGCSTAPEQKPEEVLRGALEAILPYPNTAYREVFERIVEDPANYQGDEAVRTLTSEAEQSFRKELTKLYGSYFTEECLDSLVSSSTLGLELMVWQDDVTVKVDEIIITPLADGKNYSFTVTLTCTTPEGEAQGGITGSAQCLPEDKGKISYLRWEADKALLRALELS